MDLEQMSINGPWNQSWFPTIRAARVRNSFSLPLGNVFYEGERTVRRTSSSSRLKLQTVYSCSEFKFITLTNWKTWVVGFWGFSLAGNDVFGIGVLRWFLSTSGDAWLYSVCRVVCVGQKVATERPVCAISLRWWCGGASVWKEDESYKMGLKVKVGFDSALVGAWCSFHKTYGIYRPLLKVN